MRRTLKRNLLSTCLLLLLVISVSMTTMAASKNSVKLASLKQYSIGQFKSGVWNPPLKVKYSGNKLIAEFALVNNTDRTIKLLYDQHFKLYYNGQAIVDKTVKKIKIKVNPRTIKKLTVKVPFSKKKQKKYPLSKGNITGKSLDLWGHVKAQ